MLRAVRAAATVAAGLVLASCASESPAAPPTPTQDSISSQATQELLSCLSEKGWDVSLGSTGGVHANYPAEQQTAYQADLDSCISYGSYSQTPTLTEEQLTGLYSAYVKQHDCLVDAGYPVSEAPTLQTFLDTAATQQWVPWQNLPEDSIPGALDKCPQPPLL